MYIDVIAALTAYRNNAGNITILVTEITKAA
jgi:hypothetical protein